MTSSHSKKMAAAGAGLSILLAGALASCAQENPRPSADPTSFSSPVKPSTPAPSTDSTAVATDSAADAKWGDPTNVVPLTGPVKLAPPNSEEAALEVTYELMVRYSKLESELEKSKSTNTKPAEDFVTGRLLAQLKADTKVFAEADWTFEGSATLERIADLHGSYARTAQATGKDGKVTKTPHGATWLRYCVDTSKVKILAGKDGKKPVVDDQVRRLFEAQGIYDANAGRWFLKELRPVEGTDQETSC